MAINTTYGVGGYCQDCSPNHPHPFNNIVGQEEVPDIYASKQSAVDKLKKLGLTEDEIRGLSL